MVKLALFFSCNHNYTSTSKGGTDKLNFSMGLKYNDKDSPKRQWNGNISQYTWNSGGYNLEYDGISRLTSARGSLGAYFEEQIEYDNNGAGNGNITKLKRWTKTGSGYTSIDDLTYNYANGGTSNQLMSVNDASGQSAGYNNTSNSGDDFVYDNNGNLTKDKDKSIKTITYNLLNLVRTVEGETTEGTGDLRNITQSYVWDAAGSKLKYKSGAGIEKIYIGATEYAKNTNNVIAPSRIATEEGHIALRADWTENDPRTKYVYYYTVKDHLGSVRIVIDDSQDAEVHQRNNYSAFGMLELGTEGQTPAIAKKFNDRFYNGKEQQDVVGWYDFGARMYNSELGRWMNIDPLAEKGRRWSPYTYAFDNPMRFIDPDGMQAMSPIYVAGKFMGTDNQGFKGDPILMSSKSYNSLNLGQKDQITNGTLNHSEALKLGSTLGQKIDKLASVKGGSDVSSEIREINSVINHVVSKTEGSNDYSLDNLHNGSVSSAYDNYSINNAQRVFGSANDGHTAEAFANRGSSSKSAKNSLLELNY